MRTHNSLSSPAPIPPTPQPPPPSAMARLRASFAICTYPISRGVCVIAASKASVCHYRAQFTQLARLAVAAPNIAKQAGLLGTLMAMKNATFCPMPYKNQQGCRNGSGWMHVPKATDT